MTVDTIKKKQPYILVTGGAGYIGSHAVSRLLESGYQVVVIDNLSTGSELLVDSRAHFERADLREKGELKAVFDRYSISAVLHFAASTEVARSVVDPLAFYQNNVTGSMNLIEQCLNHNVQNFIFSSTAAVYADPQGTRVHEKSSVDPKTPYGKSKWMTELVLRDLAQQKKIKALVFRYFNVGGADPLLRRGQWGEQHTVLIKRAAVAAVDGHTQMKIFGTDYPTKDGTGVRDFIHVEDLVDLHVRGLEFFESPDFFFDLINCGYGKGFSVKEVISMMEKVSGKNIPAIIAPRREGDLAEVVADVSYLHKRLKWVPKFDSLEVICRTAYEWELKTKKTNITQ